MRNNIIGILCLLFSFPIYGSDTSQTYATIGGGFLSFDDGVDRLNPFQVFGRFGHDFNEHIGFGVEAGFSLIDDELLGVDYDVSTVFLYLKGSLPISDDAKFYGMIGPASTELTATLGDISSSADDNDTAMGFGFETNSGFSTFSIDYILYNGNDGAEVDAINLGYVINF